MAKADHGSWKYLYIPILNTIDKDIYEVDTYKCDFYTAQRNSKELFVANKKTQISQKVSIQYLYSEPSKYSKYSTFYDIR